MICAARNRSCCRGSLLLRTTLYAWQSGWSHLAQVQMRVLFRVQSPQLVAEWILQHHVILIDPSARLLKLHRWQRLRLFLRGAAEPYIRFCLLMCEAGWRIFRRGDGSTLWPTRPRATSALELSQRAQAAKGPASVSHPLRPQHANNTMQISCNSCLPPACSMSSLDICLLQLTRCARGGASLASPGQHPNPTMRPPTCSTPVHPIA